MNTLYLFADEKQLFDKLPNELKEGWQVEEETLSFEDSDVHRKMRMRFFRIHDPKLETFCDQAKKADSVEELANLVQETDLSAVNDADLMELFFVLGPEPLTLVIQNLLNEISADSDLEDLAALTVIRNSLLTSLQKQSV